MLRKSFLSTLTTASLFVLGALVPGASAAGVDVPNHCFSWGSLSCGDKGVRDAILSENDATTATPSVATAPDGSGLAVWETWDGSSYAVKARRIDRFGRAGDLLTLDSGPQNIGNPKTTIAFNGTATVVYAACDATCVKAVRVPPKGAVAAPVVISADGVGVKDYEVSAATAPRGLTRAVWVDNNSASVQAAVMRADGTVEAGAAISDTGITARNPVVAVSSIGSFQFAWNRVSPTTSLWTIEVRRIYPGGSVGPVDTIADDASNLSEPNLAVSKIGTTAIAWQKEIGAWPQVAVAQATHLNFMGKSGSIETLSPETTQYYGNSMVCCGQYSLMPQVGIDDRGTARIAWTRYTGRDNFSLEAVTYNRAGNVSKLETVDDTHYGPTWLRIATTPAGVSTVLLQRIIYGGAGRIESFRWDALGKRSKDKLLTAHGDRSTEYPIVSLSSGATAALGIWQKDRDGKIFSARFG